MLKTRNLGAYRDLLLLFTRYGRKDFRLTLNAEDFLLAEAETAEIEPDVKARAEAFAVALQKMGADLRQVRPAALHPPDIVPQEYIDALESLQDSLEPFSYADVERIVEEDLGVRISKAFEHFEAVPDRCRIAGTSPSRRLRHGRNDGTDLRDVVIKVQRPNVREQVPPRPRSLHRHRHRARKAHRDRPQDEPRVAAIEQARLVMLSELNYLQEARNTETLRRNLGDFEQLYIPRVIHDFTLAARADQWSSYAGQKVSKLTPLALIEGDYAEPGRDPDPRLSQADLRRRHLAQRPASGQRFRRENPDDEEGSPQIVLLDFGMISRISQEFQDEVIKLLLAISANRGSEVADTCVRLCEVQERFDRCASRARSPRSSPPCTTPAPKTSTPDS